MSTISVDTITDEAGTGPVDFSQGFTVDGSVFGGTPTGAVIYHAANSPPTGFIKANGAAISRTTYADLFAIVGTTYGVGDGSTTFELPDLRGEFMRGWDDGRGIDTGRAFGSAQGDAIRNITGTLDASKPPVASGVFTVQGGFSGGADGGQNTVSRYTFDASTVVPTAAENRPRSIALLACIKH